METVRWSLNKDGILEVGLRGGEEPVPPRHEIFYEVDREARARGIWLAGRACCMPMQPEGGWLLTVQACKLPCISLPGYTGLRAEYRPVPVTKGQVDARLRELARAKESMAETMQPATGQDAVVLDYDMRLPEGTPFPGSRCRGGRFDLRTAEGLLPEIRQAVTGLRPGQDFCCRAVLPAWHMARGLAGRAVEVQGRVQAVLEQRQPGLDDGLARLYGYGSLAALRAALAQEAEKQADRLGRRAAGQRVLDGICAAAQMELPELAVELEVNEQQRRLDERLKRSGIARQQHLRRLRKTEQQLEQDFARYARRELHSRFVLLAIACTEGLDVTEQELEKAADTARRVHRMQTVDRMQLRQRLCAQKAADHVLANTDFVCAGR